MLLKELIARLEQEDPNLVLPNGFTTPYSYRGHYRDLAFKPTPNVPIEVMLKSARAAIGETYYGYKGGTYTMSEWTDCWLAEYGETGDLLGSRLINYMIQEAKIRLFLERIKQESLLVFKIGE